MAKRTSFFLIALCAVLGIMAFMPDWAQAASKVKYKIDVDIANQFVTVYRLSDNAIVRQMICSTGKNNGTPRGTFKLYTRKSTDRKAWYHINSRYWV